MKQKSVRVWFVLVVLAMVFSGFMISLASSHTGGSSVLNVADTKPVNLIGTWTQSSGMPGTTMTAVITDGKISIDVEMQNNVSGLYWSGSFDTSVRTGSQFSVDSTADQTEMSGEMFASQDGSKIFVYNNGDLSFHFSIMGMNSVVHLTRSSQ